MLYSITLSPVNNDHQYLVKIDGELFCAGRPRISLNSFLKADAFFTEIFMIVRSSSIQRLQLGFVKVFIVITGLICFTNLNGMHLRGYVRDVSDLNFWSKWAEHKSGFCMFLRRLRRSDK